MAATRLSDNQKSELVSAFQAGENTQILAVRFGCSANTVTRVARAALGIKAYEQLKRQRSRGGLEAAATELLELTVTVPDALTAEASQAVAEDLSDPSAPFELSVGALGTGVSEEREDEPALVDQDLRPGAAAEVGRESDRDVPSVDDADAGAIAAVVLDPGVVAEIDAEVDSDVDSEYGDDDDDLIGDDDDDAVDVDPEFSLDTDQDGFLPIAVLGFGADDHGEPAEIRSLTSAQLPASVYMLVDKTVELQARLLSEISELGQLPPDEQNRQALVVFTNPRQAKRLCGRTQRVIKLPDTRVIERTAPYLLNQGISRVVIEGALYALPGS